jgi:hypothetical protein
MSALESIKQAHGVLVREAKQFPATIAVVVADTSKRVWLWHRTYMNRKVHSLV